jgi:cytochrome c biogenesis protein CcdA
MIGALGEGAAQSLLPCSWAILLPSLAVGLSTKKPRWLAVFWVSVSLASWTVATGALASPPAWLAGLLLMGGAALYWMAPPGWGVGAALIMVGAGSAWAWRPCVGPALGEVLNRALADPWAALPGLAAYLLGLTGVGIVLGRAVGRLPRHDWRRSAAIAVAVMGTTMLVGIYPSLSSTLARWSVALWA